MNRAPISTQRLWVNPVLGPARGWRDRTCSTTVPPRISRRFRGRLLSVLLCASTRLRLLLLVCLSLPACTRGDALDDLKAAESSGGDGPTSPDDDPSSDDEDSGMHRDAGDDDVPGDDDAQPDASHHDASVDDAGRADDSGVALVPDGGEPVEPDGGLSGSCEDDLQNGNEPFPDCGKDCPTRCVDDAPCFVDEDCQSLHCDGLCQAATCEDEIQNGLEAGTDCGSSCGVGCPDGTPCTDPADCESRVCDALCQAPDCFDLSKNASETGRGLWRRGVRPVCRWTRLPRRRGLPKRRVRRGSMSGADL